MTRAIPFKVFKVSVPFVDAGGSATFDLPFYAMAQTERGAEAIVADHLRSLMRTSRPDGGDLIEVGRLGLPVLGRDPPSSSGAAATQPEYEMPFGYAIPFGSEAGEMGGA